MEGDFSARLGTLRQTTIIWNVEVDFFVLNVVENNIDFEKYARKVNTKSKKSKTQRYLIFNNQNFIGFNYMALSYLV